MLTCEILLQRKFYMSLNYKVHLQ